MASEVERALEAAVESLNLVNQIKAKKTSWKHQAAAITQLEKTIRLLAQAKIVAK